MLAPMAHPISPHARRLAHLTLLCALSACGGGGSESPPTASPAASPAPPAAASAPPAPVTAGTRATCSLPGFQAELLAAVNAARASGATCGSQTLPAAPALSWNAALTQAALVHSDDMVAHNFFSHTGSDGRNAGQRATAAGYAWRTWGENIAAGQGSVAQVMAGWMASPGHCANVMHTAFRDIGVACVSGGAGNTYRSYWTMVLGAGG
jgi:uncharacterized protein YkwD